MLKLTGARGLKASPGVDTRHLLKSISQTIHTRRHPGSDVESTIVQITPLLKRKIGRKQVRPHNVTNIDVITGLLPITKDMKCFPV